MKDYNYYYEKYGNDCVIKGHISLHELDGEYFLFHNIVTRGWMGTDKRTIVSDCESKEDAIQQYKKLVKENGGESNG